MSSSNSFPALGRWRCGYRKAVHVCPPELSALEPYKSEALTSYVYRRGQRQASESSPWGQHGQWDPISRWINRNRLLKAASGLHTGRHRQAHPRTLWHTHTPATLKTVGRLPLLTSISCLSHSSNSLFLRVWWAIRCDPPMMCGSLPAPGNRTWKTGSSEARHI